MTVMAERTDATEVTVEMFEIIARHVATGTEGAVRLEFIGGRIEEKRVPDGDHTSIFSWLLRRCMQSRPELDLAPEQGLKVERYREGRARPDAALVPAEHFAGQGEWAEPDGVLMTVEVTSHDRDTDRRDRKEKPAAYAAAGIPVYLLIDRDEGTVTVFTNPDAKSARYRDIHSALFGESVSIPEPVGIVLDTEKLKDYMR
ncbi:Uma2 family endonuclease [Streptomyces sp. A7024]|uniref:Uma2 family endonuclease n=1 Tax=Streptomyces coryli TaxID=1128680 RepID=A0A6G4U208_9ACTN|nr:Uma2 family endonuclease [Streptomyces coryli]NGN66265.1 Uma2 family endonuclease [Streptomyces coryli]